LAQGCSDFSVLEIEAMPTATVRSVDRFAGSLRPRSQETRGEFMLAGQPGAAGSEWRRSHSCVGEGHCVEFSIVDGGSQVRMRNSTAPETVLTFGMDEWRKFLSAVKAGELPLTH
jgi:hypothetical protein